MNAVKEDQESCPLFVCGECSRSFVLTGTVSVSGSDVGTRTSASARTPSASLSSNVDGSIPSYLYDLDDEEAAELLGACTPQDTDEEGSVELAEQGNRARASIPSYLYDLDDEEAAELFAADTPRGIDAEGFCKCGGPRRAPATPPPRQYWDAEGTEEFPEADTSSSDNSRCYERAEEGLSSAGAPRRPVFMGEGPLTSRLERMKLFCTMHPLIPGVLGKERMKLRESWYLMETSD